MAGCVPSECVTQGFRVRVTPEYHEEHSDPAKPVFVFAYTIRVDNESPAPAKLLWRHWTITNAEGVAREVRGSGVIGEQPRLEPSQAFEYRSYCPLDTESGAMKGTFTMERDDGSLFEVEVAEFGLEVPNA